MNDPDFWNREFPITSVTRSDVVTAGFTRKSVEAITNEQMQQIASKMEDYYCDGSYWTDLKIATIFVTAKEGGRAGD